MESDNILFSKTRYQKSYPILGLTFAVIMVTLLSARECQAVTLTITANNGSVTATPAKADYNIGEIVELIPKPGTGYCFTGWADDARGKTLVLNLTMDSNKTIIANFDTWQPPIGIPEPEFGIFETYRMYDNPANRNPDLTYNQNSEGGFYTHYVDWTDLSATDTSNPYGTEAIPRKTVPSSTVAAIPEGSVIEIHGGPYSPGGLPYPTYMKYLNSAGTADKPVFIRSIESEPALWQGMTTILLQGSYMIIENMEFDDSRLQGHHSISADHISIRNNEFYGGVFTKSVVVYVAQNQYIVVYDNYIHNSGDPYSEDENDWVGVQAGDSKVETDRHAEYVWVVDNHIHDIGSDGVQLNSGAERDVEDLPRHIYIGRNLIYNCGENAVDMKQSADVVFSQNTVHTFLAWSSGSDGTAIVVNDDAPHENIWVIYNTIYDSRIGIRAQEGCHIIGNEIYDIYHDPDDATYNPLAPWPGAGPGIMAWGNIDVDIIGNTLYNTDTGIVFPSGTTSNVNIINNIVGELNEVGLYIVVRYADVAANAVFKNSLLYNSNVKILWNATTYTSIAAFQVATGKGEGCIEADPLFIDVVNNNFNLSSTNPAVDNGTLSDVYQTFYDLYGIDIRKDIEGKPRTGAWDIGAYEYVLNAVTDLSVSGTSQNSVTFFWTVPGDDGLASMPSRYDIRYATSPLTDVNWDTATQVQGEPVAGDFGASQSFTITALNPGTTYYIAIKTSNETGSTTSPLSNVISGTTATTGNFAPVLDLIGDKSVINTELLTFVISATDADGDTLFYSAPEPPPGASFNETTHTFTWTPTSSQIATYHVTFQVSDGQITVSETVTISVTGIQSTLKISSTIGGSTIPVEGTYLYGVGTAVSIQATPAENYHFVNWTGNLSGSTNPATITIDSDKSVTANFAIDQHALTISSAGDGSVTNPGEGPFLYYDGTDVSIQATPGGSGYFVNWTGTAVDADKIANPNATSTTVTVDADYTIEAHFGESDGIAPTVTNCLPAADDIQVPLNSLIILHVTDTLGVAAGSVTITLDGNTIYTGDTSEYSSANGICRRAGTPADYTYAYQSSHFFDFDQSKTVTVNAADIAGNVMPQRSYSFRTEMRSFGQNIRVDTTVQSVYKAAASTARDSIGNIWAVWHSGPTGSRDIYAAKLRTDRDTFGASVRLTSSGADQANPALALGTDDKLYIVWQDNRHGDWDIYASTSVDGINWTAPTRVNDPNEGNQVNPAIVVDGRSPNYAYVVWQDDRAGNQDICIATSSNSFVTKTVSQITSNTANQTTPAIAVDSANTVYVLWTDARNASNDIYGAAGSPWTNVPIVTKAGSQSNPAIAVESAGSILHMLWVDQISGDSDIYYASSNGLPGSPLAGSNLIDDTLGAEQISPAIAVTGSTGDDLQVFACWHDERNISDNTGDIDLYMVQTNSGDGTNVFVGDGGTNSDQIEPAMSTDQYGYPYLVWTDDRNTNMEIYFAGSIFMQLFALVSELTTASSGGTVGTDPGSITGVDDVSVVLPEGACPYDVTISITKIVNQHEFGSLPCLNGYDFGPSGIVFNTPVTITIPYAVTGAADTPTVYWYDSRAWYNQLSQQGITNIETIVITSSLHALRFKTTHFTPFYVLPGPAANTVSDTISSSDGGGGGGGCSLSHSQDGSILEYFLPYGALALFMFIFKRRDRRYRKDFDKTPLS